MLHALLRSRRLCKVPKERWSYRSLSEAGPGGDEDRQLLRELCAKVRFSGPITVAQYMQEVLTNPVHGIYSNKGPFISIGVLGVSHIWSAFQICLYIIILFMFTEMMYDV